MGVAAEVRRGAIIPQGVATLAFLGLPARALAEVSDKVPTVPEFIVVGMICGALAFGLASWKWWLAGFGAAIVAVMCGMAADLLEIREALLHELGWSYFLAGATSILIVVVATGAGAIRGWRRRRREVSRSD